MEALSVRLPMIGGLFFRWLHGNHLVYNTCWEDPRLDREALQLTADDEVLVITSAGCNALDYVLAGARRVYAVDMNYRQNALLELKIAGLRSLGHEEYFELFGRGRSSDFGRVYGRALRPLLSASAARFWDENQHFFKPTGKRPGMYFHGTSGWLARGINFYLDRRGGLREGVDAILAAQSVEEQQAIYFGGLKELFWNRLMRFAANSDAVLAMAGVPQAQRQQVERHFEGGVAQFVERCLEAVFAHLPMQDNYFWRVYLTGEYSPACCPEYLKPENFTRLKDGLWERIEVNTDTVQNFLARHARPINRFVLLDHMDWMSTHNTDALRAEWEMILAKAAPNARAIWRSGGMRVDYIDPLVVTLRGGRVSLGSLLRYHHDLAARLHARDRVHTYGSFYIADLAVAN
jgi:S-adenosylmethionine-diacylglycerol 3-amino-3-carboxypropyl transferase